MLANSPPTKSNKIETVLNNSCQFKIPAHMLNRNSAHDITMLYDVTDKESFNNVKAWMSEIDKHVSHSVNKLLVENKCDLTSQRELPTDETKELATESCDRSETCQDDR